MSRRIRDLISVNEQATLIKGVQLDWYGDPRHEAENARLATGYIFSSGGGTRGSATAINIFASIRDSLNIPNSRNIFTIIAQYGHGKSHFALVLANYFGRSADDPLIEKIIQQIEACSDPNTAAHFRSFKKNARKPQLVVRLSGHDFTDLRQGFLRALRRVLDEYEVTRDYPIKAVSTEAAKWLRSLNEQQKKRAEDYLAERHHMDLDALIEAFEQFDTSKEHIARDLSKVILGVEANFGADVNLREIIDQVVGELCSKAEAPFYKMIILFDELGIYSEKWCYNRMIAGGLAPQQMIEACDNNRGRLSFIGLIQREVTEFVKSSSIQEEFMKWAGRFPSETTYRLEANLEQVIKGLLSKNPQEWDSFARDNMPQISRESERAWEILPRYQISPDAWSQSKFLTVVGVGGFPLHPITTGLLCDLTFTQGSRTIIEVVNTLVKEAENQPAVSEGRLNWIFPTVLVDTFEDSFEGKEDRYSRYANALNHLGSNAPEILYKVLKALFLFDVGGLKKYPSQSHAIVLANICGLPEDAVKGALNQLEEEYSVIRFSQASKEYQFSGIGTNRNEIRQQIIREIAGHTVTSLAASLSTFQMFDRIMLPESEATEFKAEHAIEGDEWRLAPRLLDASKIDSEHVKRIRNEVQEARGVVIYLVSDDGVELDEAREQATGILDGIRFGENPEPIVVAIPQSPAAGIKQEVLIRQALNSWTPAKREQYGDAYTDVVKDSERRLEDAFRAHLREDGIRYFVCSLVEQDLKVSETHRLDRIADKVLEAAYPHRVPAKSHIMKIGNNQGNLAVAEVSRHLLTNDLEFGKLTQATQNLVRAVLVEGQDKWGVLTPKYRLQDPTNDRVLRAWKEIDGTIKEDRPIPFGSLLTRLSNIPYGYDDYTSTLLLAAWIGKNKNELSYTGFTDVRNRNMRPLSLADLQEQLKKARDFTKWLVEGKVQVQHTGKKKKRRANEFLKDIEEETDFEKAEGLLKSADEVLAGLAPDDEIRQQISETVDRVRAQVTKIVEYRQQVLFQRGLAEKTDDILNLLRVARLFPDKPETYLEYDESFFIETKRFVENKIEAEVNKQAQQPLKRIEGYDSIREGFKARKDALHQSGRADLEQKFIIGLERIEKEYKQLKSQQGEAIIVAEVNAMQVGGATLLSCRSFSSRLEDILASELSEGSEKTRDRVKAKQQAVIKQIGEYDKWITALPQHINNISDAEHGRRLLHEVIGREHEYDNTPEYEILKEYKREIESKLKALEETERESQDEERRHDRNRRIVAERAQQSERARTLMEIENAVASIESARQLLESPADDQIEALEIASQQLIARAKRINDWVTETLAEEIKNAWTIQDVKRLRNEVVTYESTCAGNSTLVFALDQRREQLDSRIELLNGLTRIEQQCETLADCELGLAELSNLRSRYPDAENRITTLEHTLGEKVNSFVAEQRQLASQWLTHFDTALRDGVEPQQANVLIRELDHPPVKFDAKEEAVLTTIRQKLNVLRDQDIINRITDDFTNLQTAEQRAVCLLRIAEICKAEGLSAEYIDKLVQLFELRAKV